VPGQPGRRYERNTNRPGGRYKTRKPGETTRLTADQDRFLADAGTCLT